MANHVLPTPYRHLLLLLSPKPLSITSPRNAHPCPVIQRKAASFAALTRTCRAIHAETTPLFYTQNTFLVSNGEYASPHFANIHGLKAFVGKNKSSIKLIKDVIFEVRFGERLTVKESAVKEMKAIARMLVKNFTGVESLGLEIREEAIWKSGYVDDDAILERDESKAELAAVVKLVVKHKGLRELKWLGRQRDVLGKVGALVEKEMKVQKGAVDRVKVVCLEGVEERVDVKCRHCHCGKCFL